MCDLIILPLPFVEELNLTLMMSMLMLMRMPQMRCECECLGGITELFSTDVDTDADALDKVRVSWS